MHNVTFVLDIVFLLGLGWLVWTTWSRRWAGPAEGLAQRRARQLKPHSPRDCRQCRATEGQCCAERQQRGVEPWSSHKSQRGRLKTVARDGYACMKPACEYYGVTCGGVHALVSHGQRGKLERSQRWAGEE